MARDVAGRPPEELEIVIGDPTGGQMEISSRPVHQAPLLPIQDYEHSYFSQNVLGGGS